MSDDAKFEDGVERPLRLMAVDKEDLQVVSALTQDSVFPASEMTWSAADRRFAILLNRFRWEDAEGATSRKRDVERVQAVIVVEDVLGVRSQGIEKGDADTILSLLSVEHVVEDSGVERVVFTLAGDGAIECEVEALEVVLKDVTRPYIAPSGQQPSHPD